MKKILLALNLFLASISHAEVAVEEQPVVILGSGVAALTSAIYLARAGIAPVVITGPSMGGTITQSHNVQNWPGEISISGIDLSEKVKKQAELNGAVLQHEVVVGVDFSKRPFTITTKKILSDSQELKKYKAQACIIALGAKPNLLGVPGEESFFSRGVYTCAVCDGSLYKDKVVAVVGGGDSALIESQYLANIASEVHVLVRRDAFHTIEMERMKEVLATPNIKVHFNTIVKEVKGDAEKATHLLIEKTDTKGASTLPIDALFLAIGSQPNTDMFRGQLDLDPKGYIILKNNQMTSVEGVYAVGDVSDPEFKQAVSAAGDAAKAALQAQKLIASTVLPMKQVGKAKELNEVKSVIEITSKTHFEKEVREAKGPVFVDFYANYCGPCRTFGPLYENWAKEFGGKIKFLKVNSEHNRELSQVFGIQAIPTLVILDEKGTLVRKSVGFREIAEVEKRLMEFKEKTEFDPQDFK